MKITTIEKLRRQKPKRGQRPGPNTELDFLRRHEIDLKLLAPMMGYSYVHLYKSLMGQVNASRAFWERLHEIIIVIEETTNTRYF